MASKFETPRDVTLAALGNLIRLMGAELVAGQHRDDIERFERAVRAKLRDIRVADCAPETVAAGLDEADALVEAALAQVRDQWRTVQRAPRTKARSPRVGLH